MAIKETSLKLNCEIREILASCISYQEFLREFLKQQNLSYSSFARRAGFLSRSFPRDLVTGKRKLTTRSLAAFLSGFRFNSHDARYLQLLICLSESSIRSTLGFDDDKGLINEFVLAKSRFISGNIKKIRNTTSYKNRPSTIESLLKDPQLVMTYAALGTANQHSTYEQLCRRLGKSLSDVKSLVETLRKIGLCRKTEKGFIALSWHECYKGAGDSKHFSGFFRAACFRAANRVLDHAKSSDELFFSSALLVNRSRLSELKEKLRSVLSEFIDDAICQDGEVLELCCAFHKTSDLANKVPKIDL